MTEKEFIELKSVDKDRYERLMYEYCEDVFIRNEYGHFNGLYIDVCQFYKEGSDDGLLSIVFECVDDDGWRYMLITSFNGVELKSRVLMNPFKDAVFGEKFLTVNGSVVIYQRKIFDEYNGNVVKHLLVSKTFVSEYLSDGKVVGAAFKIDGWDVIGKIGIDCMVDDVIKSFVRKEIGCDGDGYAQGFLDGYSNGVIGLNLK